MGIIFKSSLVGFLAVFAYFYYVFNTEYHFDYTLPENGYFGEGKEKPDHTKVVPFKINVPEEEIKDLKLRLKSSRIGHSALQEVTDFSYGFNVNTAKKWRDYWLNSFDWRKQEELLNSFPHFKTQIEGLQIHFIHLKPNKNVYKKVVPLLLVHGWPGNVFEFYKIIPMLTDPKRFGFGDDVAFEVVVPSIPGYGWSEQPKKKGFHALVTSRIFRKLMNRLGHKKFIAQGGDWGGLVTAGIAHLYPESLIGLHVNILFTGTGTPRYNLKTMIGSIFPKCIFSESQHENFSIKNKLWVMLKEMGYMHIQSTKPDTVGFSLNDSPLGLLAYIGEKFSTWTNKDFEYLVDGGIEKKFSKDEVLTIVSIYWFNQNIVSSQRYYRENFGDYDMLQYLGNYISVPVGYAAFANEIVVEPIELAKETYNITSIKHFNDGGHFAAFELPKDLAGHIFEFTRTLV